jgi:hypothetical protein
MNFVVSSVPKTVLAKKCQGLYTKINRKDQVCYLKLNDVTFAVEYIIRRSEDADTSRWEMIEQNTSKIRAFHTSDESCESLDTHWTIFSGSNRRKGMLKFVEVEDLPKKGKKRGREDFDGKKNTKRVFGRKVSQDCKPLVPLVNKQKPCTKKRTKVHSSTYDGNSILPGKLLCDLETADDELYVTEYVEDIIDHLKSVECNFLPLANYVEQKQPQLSSSNRTTLLNWMNAVVSKYEQTNATYHLSVNIFDRFLSSTMVKRSQLHLVGCVCLWLAAKYIEVHVPVMDDFVALADDLFDTEDMLSMECAIVNSLDFELTVPSSLNFAERYGHIIKHMLALEKQRRRILPLINFFIEHCTLIYELVGEKPSLIAASASYAAALWLDRDFEWTQQLVIVIGYSVEDMKPIVALIKHQVYENKREKKTACF